MDLLQAAIARMAGHCFAIKGWSITVTTAVIAVATKGGDPAFVSIGLLPVILFWGLDAYYLVLERRFRLLFKAAVTRLASDEGATFEMSPGAVNFREVVSTTARPALLFVHGALLIVVILVRVLG